MVFRVVILSASFCDKYFFISLQCHCIWIWRYFQLNKLLQIFFIFFINFFSGLTMFITRSWSNCWAPLKSNMLSVVPESACLNHMVYDQVMQVCTPSLYFQKVCNQYPGKKKKIIMQQSNSMNADVVLNFYVLQFLQPLVTIMYRHCLQVLDDNVLIFVNPNLKYV